MKFKNPFKRGKTQSKPLFPVKTHSPEELIACPLCGHKYWIGSMKINSTITEHKRDPEWLSKFWCVGGMQGGGCGEHFWVAGSYNKILGTQPIGI